MIRVLGIGNVLMGDDALGPYVVRTLEARYRIPEAVSVEDLGTPGLDLTAFLEGADAAIVIDAVRAIGRPGELRCYDKEAVLGKRPVLALSPHEPGLREALLASDFHGAAPREILLVGVIPERVDGCMGLSPAVQRAVPEVLLEVISQLARLGMPAEERRPPLVPDIWWER